MPELSWACEGTDGATVTTANSGLDGVAIGTAGAMTYDGANTLFGSTCVKVVAGTAGVTEASWSTQLGTVTTLYARWYLKWGALPGAAGRLLQGMCSGSQSGFGMDGGTDGSLATKDASSGTWGTTAAIPAGQWVRVEMDAPVFGMLVSPVLRLYLSPHSTTPDSTLTGVMRNIGLSCNFFRLPIRAAGFTAYYDEVALSTTAQPGPKTLGPARPVLSPPTAVRMRSYNY